MTAFFGFFVFINNFNKFNARTDGLNLFENIAENRGFIFVVLIIFYLQTIFNSPIFILKNELLQIPIFGWYLKKIGSISVRRNKITKDNLGVVEEYAGTYR